MNLSLSVILLFPCVAHQQTSFGVRLYILQYISCPLIGWENKVISTLFLVRTLLLSGFFRGLIAAG